MLCSFFNKFSAEQRLTINESHCCSITLASHLLFMPAGGRPAAGVSAHGHAVRVFSSG